MSNLFVAAANPYPRVLNVEPMIQALHFQPTDFEFERGWLLHVPSHHRFQFDRSGNVSIDAVCGCAGLSARREQAAELYSAFNTWKDTYWRSVEIDREFASHFAEPSAVVRFLRDVRIAWRKFVSAPSRRHAPSRSPAPAE